MNSIRLILSLMVACLLETRGVERKSMDVTVKVVDEQGKTVPRALILGGSEGESSNVSKATDELGCAVFHDAMRTASFSPKIVAPGYYEARGRFIADVALPGTEREYRVMLKKVIRPVPLETKEMDYVVGRTFDQDIGFDLEKLDWVVPAGRGVHTDLVFRARWERVERRNHPGAPLAHGTRSIVTIRTVGARNGILPFLSVNISESYDPGSVFIPPQAVPETGLTNEVVVTSEWYDDIGPILSENENKHYAFRVRSELDERGEISRAHVGWIQGDVIAAAYLHPEKTPKGKFPPPSQFVPDRFGVKFTRHWNPNPESNRLEPNTPELRWENRLSDLIRGYKLQDLPGIEELKPLDRNDPQWIPSPEEQRAERKAEEAERLRQRQAINKANQEKYLRENPHEVERYYKDHPPP
ncbi:MAG: hypothetical protein U1F87_08155 [Kiritimatiellia bacterium]